MTLKGNKENREEIKAEKKKKKQASDSLVITTKLHLCSVISRIRWLRVPIYISDCKDTKCKLAKSSSQEMFIKTPTPHHSVLQQT
jgi:hypothetical protein